MEISRLADARASSYQSNQNTSLPAGITLYIQDCKWLDLITLFLSPVFKKTKCLGGIPSRLIKWISFLLQQYFYISVYLVSASGITITVQDNGSCGKMSSGGCCCFKLSISQITKSNPTHKKGNEEAIRQLHPS